MWFPAFSNIILRLFHDLFQFHGDTSELGINLQDRYVRGER
jgi:hypothetical protein